MLNIENVNVVNAKDIATMKIMAVSQRCTKRDFFHLYWYIKNQEPLDEIINRVSKIYPNKNHNIHHFLKSLLYFEEAESNPDPTIYFAATWNEVKKFFEKIVPTTAKKILEL